MEEFKHSDDKVLSGMTSTALFEYVHSLEDTVASLSNNVANLTEQIRIMNERAYGRKTETAAVLDMPQLDLGLNEAEALADEKGVKKIHISLSHCKEYPVAQVVLED